MNMSLNLGETLAHTRYDALILPPRVPRPQPSQIKTAIAMLQNNPTSLSLSMLEDILLLRYLPAHLHILNARVIPSCIVLLEQSAKRNTVSGYNYASKQRLILLWPDGGFWARI
jgi:hypothetical protein